MLHDGRAICIRPKPSLLDVWIWRGNYYEANRGDIPCAESVVAGVFEANPEDVLTYVRGNKQ